MASQNISHKLSRIALVDEKDDNQWEPGGLTGLPSTADQRREGVD